MGVSGRWRPAAAECPVLVESGPSFTTSTTRERRPSELQPTVAVGTITSKLAAVIAVPGASCANSVGVKNPVPSAS